MKKRNTFQPVAVYDAMSLIRPLWLAVEREGEVVSIIVSDTTRFDLFTRMALIGQIQPPGHKTRLVISETDPQVVAGRLKRHAIEWGATPEAIRLLGLVCPLEDEEVKQMAKLARKDELKEAAKSTPVAKPKAVAAKRTLSPELAEKNNARVEARDKQKIKVLKKEHGAREGTKRAERLDIVLGCKTVGEAIENGAEWIDVKFAVESELVELA